MKNIAIFASGSGTNAENIIRYFSANEHINVSLVLSNNRSAGVHERANRWGVPSFVFTREELTAAAPVIEKLAGYDVGFIVLAGFMLKISPTLLAAFPGRIINIHPALLPRHGGKGMYGMHVHEAVVAAGENESGITIHYINEQYDEGAIIFQAACPLLPSDSPEEVAAKVHALEYAHYPPVIEQVVNGEHYSSPLV
ncbi:MAG: phosphoribosylglycinamide formyltransferase [Tannerellaceae bacterium]|jgi:phosphoribosylglycinamide formyltransferase-1|nr:phosphoribosylglycinamide formyltransferase [Tannerellaceae bacterium]